MAVYTNIFTPSPPLRSGASSEALGSETTR